VIVKITPHSSINIQMVNANICMKRLLIPSVLQLRKSEVHSGGLHFSYPIENASAVLRKTGKLAPIA